MARSKSTSGGKTNANINKEQASVTNSGTAPDVQTNVQAVAAETAPLATKPESKIALEPRKKLEVVKNEPRRVVPINVEEEIRRRAYELYQQRGAKPGSEREDWLAAEREVRQRYHQQQSA
jgi:Protein of unknown function (DUF2934)